MLPLSRGDLSPVTGQARSRPEDTLLNEVLVRSPDGGDHFWLRVQSTGLGHRQMMAAVARAAGVDPSAVASAGSRDRHAVVQQWVSVAKNLVDNPGQLAGAGYKRQLKVLEVREGAGPLSGEQVSALDCRLRIRGGAAGEGFERAQALLRHLRGQGVPNYFGAATMGPSGSHARWGKVLAQGKRLPGRVKASPRDRLLYERAWQARLFNAWVASRLQGPGLATVLAGDWLQTRCNEPVQRRPVMQVEDVEAAQKRVEAWESVVLGPLWGDGVVAAGGQAAEWEQRVVSEMGSPPSQRCRGGQRALRFQPKGGSVERSGDDILISSTIPVDSFAAVLAEEFVAAGGHLP